MSGHRMLALTVGDERTASTRYRVHAHLPALRAAGFETEVRPPVAGTAGGPLRWVRRAADLLRDVTGSRDGADLVLVQRKTYPPPLARRLARPGQPLVLDVDDAIDLPPPHRNAGPATLGRYRRNFEATAAAARLVLAGNAELAGRLPHRRFEIVPTPIDTERFAPGAVEPAAGPVLGWVGHSSNLVYLEALGEPLRELARRHPGLRLVVAADRPPRLRGVDVEFRRWSLETELSCFGGIAIGLMPLRDTPWARSKCAFKAIQYMALGIPAVASPVGANREVIRHGETGFLPETPADWVEALDALLRDAALARRVGAAGRDAVLGEYSLEVVSRKVVEILRGIVGGAD